MAATASDRLQRASGESRVAFAVRDGQTRLADLYQRDPCRVLFPDPEPGEPPQAVLVTTSGGATDGDRLGMAVEVGPGAEAVAATQAAEKIYRAAKSAEHCSMEIALTIGEKRAGKLAWTDTLRVEGETPLGAGFGEANALATVIGVRDAPEPYFEKARRLLEAADKVRAGVTLVNGIVVARLLGEATSVRAATTRFLGDLRGRRLPRVWHI